jgi:hypothetical protein
MAQHSRDQGPQPRGLKDEEDLAFQRLEWRVQRVGTLALVLIVIAGVLGVFGDGPLARGSARTSDDALQLRFDRFVRREAPTTLEVDIAPGVGTGDADELALSLSRTYVDAISIEHVSPAPARVEQDARRVHYVFRRHARGPLHIRFDLTPSAIGSIRAEVGIVGGSLARFQQFAYF